MSLPKFEHVILTRYNLGIYDRKDAEQWMEHRYKLFQQTRESVLTQDADFKWVLFMDDRTPTRWLYRIITDKRMRFEHCHPKDYRQLGWTITTRLDNDDVFLPGAFNAIQNAFEPKEMILDVKYYQESQGNLYTSERDAPNSPFLSLIENDVKRTCYARPHSKMTEEYPAKFVDNQIHALMTIHDWNAGNKIIGKRVR